jgi:hypothetical protein
MFLVAMFAAQVLDVERIEGTDSSVKSMLSDADSNDILLFITTPGADPSREIEEAAKQMAEGYHEV